MFKILDKDSGLYARGGSYHSFSKNGKTWNQKNHLNSHLSLCENYSDSCVIVEIDIEAVPPTITEHNMREWNKVRYQDQAVRDEKRKILQEKRLAEWRNKNVRV